MKSTARITRRFAGLALLALTALLPASLVAQAFIFNAPSGAWSDSGNWDHRDLLGNFPDRYYSYYAAGDVPDLADDAYIIGGRTATLGTGTSGSAYRVYIGEGPNFTSPQSSGTLNITGGDLTSSNGYIQYGGTVNVSAGTWFVSDNTPQSLLHIYNGALNLTGTGVVQVGLNSVGTLSMEPSSGTAVLNIGTGGTAGTLAAARIVGNGNAVVNFNHTGDVTFDTRLTGLLSVTKSGVGTTVLTGANTYAGESGNTYSGGTIINEGTLVAGGGFSGTKSSLGTGTVTVNDGGTLAGNDHITGHTTITEGGHLAPDAGGVFRFDAGLTLEDGAILDLSLGSGPPFSILVNGGVFNAAGIITVNLTDSGDFAAGTPYTLIDFNGAITVNNTATFQLGTQIAGFTTVLSFDGNSLVATATVAPAVPEPSTYAALAGLGALAFAFTRRRR
ncbi:MAG: autotransporter [Rariglobus sp.]|nr:autotransporter [Rariglobus sp.]